MGTGSKRWIVRWIHIISGLPLIGFIYGPPAETEPYRYMFQYIFVPVLLLTGLWMWKSHVVGKVLVGRSERGDMRS